MTRDNLLLIQAAVFIGLLALAMLVWAGWVRPYVKRRGARTAHPYSFVALLTDYITGLSYSRGQVPWSLRIFGLILLLLLSDVVLAALLVLFGH